MTHEEGVMDDAKLRICVDLQLCHELSPKKPGRNGLLEQGRINFVWTRPDYRDIRFSKRCVSSESKPIEVVQNNRSCLLRNIYHATC